jgi:hypothetical protein
LHKNTDENNDIIGGEVNFTGANWNLDNCRQKICPEGELIHALRIMWEYKSYT